MEEVEECKILGGCQKAPSSPYGTSSYMDVLKDMTTRVVEENEARQFELLHFGHENVPLSHFATECMAATWLHTIKLLVAYVFNIQ